MKFGGTCVICVIPPGPLNPSSCPHACRAAGELCGGRALPPDQDLALPAPSGSLQGSWSLGVSSLKNLTHRIVYQYNFLIFCSGVASSVQCRCAMCRAGDDLALVCACLATSPCWGLLWLASLLVPPCTLPLLHKIFPQPPQFIFTIHTSLCCHHPALGVGVFPPCPLH